MDNIQDDKWFCAKNVLTQAIICSSIDQVDKRFTELETARKVGIVIFIKTKYGYEYCKILYVGTKQGAKKAMENNKAQANKIFQSPSISNKLENSLDHVHQSQEKILSTLELILKKQDAQESKIDSISKDLQAFKNQLKILAMPRSSPSKSVSGIHSPTESESSQKTDISNKSYVPEGLAKTPAASGRNELKHIYPVNRFIPNTHYEIRSIGVQILEACRKNREWLRAAENLKIRGIDEASMQKVRALLVDGPSCVRKLSRDLSSVVYGDEILSTHIIGFNGKGGKNTKADPTKTGSDRQIMPIEEENKMRKIYAFIDEIFERQAVWKELVSDPINQKGRETKVKLRTKPNECGTSHDYCDQ